ncbi:MAG: bacillithiol biosynthesis BshC, partial [Saprospiraceae bacterium]|nr:bacillithiol biosynthesis BshC [Saprospiraceae bacterium]
MEVNKINFDDVKAFSRRDKIYRNHPEEFRDFIAYMPNWEGFGQAIADRAEHKVDRKLLHSVITDHYTKCPASILQNTNISRLLDENCFTVVTAHQPSLLTGPLYYIYKIFSAINLAEDLSKQFPANHFVPVFISGSEDHDFQEVNHLHLFGKIFEWKKEAGGPVGRYDLQGFAEVVDE